MSGDLWSLWECVPDARTPPRALAIGRWGECAFAAIWSRALRGEGAAYGVPLEHVVAVVRGELFSLPADWDEHPAAQRLVEWAGGQDEMPVLLGRVMKTLAHAHDILEPPRDWGGPSLLRALWTLVELTGTREGFAQALGVLAKGGTQEEVRQRFDEFGLRVALEPPDEPQSRFQPGPTEPLADAVAAWQARDPRAFAWAAAFAEHAPPHARLVTLDDRRPGTPAPGSLWWPLAPEGWCYVSSRELVELESARGRLTKGGHVAPDGKPLLYNGQVLPGQYSWAWERDELLRGLPARVLTIPRPDMDLGLREPP